MLSTEPVINSDFADPDVIRVDDTYYMLTATRHFCPGGQILRSYDLVNWEHAAYVFDKFDGTPAETLTREQNIYGCGMEGGSLRYHNGIFYVTFCRQEIPAVYIFTATNIEGPWEKKILNEDYYLNSLFFDDDGKVYMVYGYKTIYIQEMKPDLSGPVDAASGGFFKEVLTDDDEEKFSQFSASHFQKINGVYYLSIINWRRNEPRMKTQYCFWSKSIDGDYIGGNVYRTDLGYEYQGVAQGGFIDGPDGEWYAMLYQDRGALGRSPVLVPVNFVDDVPVFETNPEKFALREVKSYRPDHKYQPLVVSDKFESDGSGQKKLDARWQWNHEPDNRLWWLKDEGGLCIKTDKLAVNLIHARDTLVQRCLYPYTSAEVTIDAHALKDGDHAGLCLLQGCYGFIGIKKDFGKYYLTVVTRELDDSPWAKSDADFLPGTVQESVLLEEPVVRVGVSADFFRRHDVAEFWYRSGDEVVKVGKKHRLYFKIDHFVGVRVGLTVFATKETEGHAIFTDFDIYDKYVE